MSLNGAIQLMLSKPSQTPDKNKLFYLHFIHSSLHGLYVICHREFRIRLTPHLLDIHTRRKLRQCQSTFHSVNLKNTLSHVSTFPPFGHSISLTKSVIIVLTHLAPVNGNAQLSTILALPSFATCSVATTIFV